MKSYLSVYREGQIAIDTEAMRNDGVRLFVASPVLHDINLLFKKSLGDLELEMARRGLPMREYFQLGNSNVWLARALCVAEFLEAPEQFTHLLFVDSDIEFDWHDAIRILATGLEVVGGTYPRKKLDWQAIKDAAKRGEIDDLEGAGTSLTHIDAEGGEKRGHLKQVAGLPGGFLCIHRDVFPKILEANPHIAFTHVDGRKIADYFPMQRVDGGYRGEDYGFCQLCAASGIPIWLDCAAVLKHHGNFAYQASQKQLERLVL